VGQVGGEALLSQQGVEQARFADPHPAEHRQPWSPLAQARQLAIQPRQLSS
jgi:hypothetical protein